MKKMITLALLTVLTVAQAQAQVKVKESEANRAARVKAAEQRAARRAGTEVKAQAATAEMYKIGKKIQESIKGTDVNLGPMEKTRLKANLTADPSLVKVIESMDKNNSETNKLIVELASSTDLKKDQTGIRDALEAMSVKDPKSVAQAQIRSMIDALAESKDWDSKSQENVKATAKVIIEALRSGKSEEQAMTEAAAKLSQLTGKEVKVEDIRKLCKQA
jgi:hypothetical protein